MDPQKNEIGSASSSFISENSVEDSQFQEIYNKRQINPKSQNYKNENQTQFEKEDQKDPVPPNTTDEQPDNIRQTKQEHKKDGNDSSKLVFEEENTNLGESNFQDRRKMNIKQLTLQKIEVDSVDQASLNHGSNSPFKNLKKIVDSDRGLIDQSSLEQQSAVSQEDESQKKDQKPVLAQASAGIGEGLTFDGQNMLSLSPLRKQLYPSAQRINRKKVSFSEDLNYKENQTPSSNENRPYFNNQINKKIDLNSIGMANEGKLRLEDTNLFKQKMGNISNQDTDEQNQTTKSVSIHQQIAQGIQLSYKSSQQDQHGSSLSSMRSKVNSSINQMLGKRKVQIEKHGILLGIGSQLSQSVSLNYKQVKERREQEKIEERNKFERQILEKMTKQIRYSDDCIGQFQDLKDVLKQRVQFSKRNMKIKKNLEAKHKNEIPETQSITVNIEQVNRFINKKQKKVEDDFADTDKSQPESKELTGFNKQIQDYEEKLLEIKDDRIFFVHGKYFTYSNRSLGMLDNKNKLRICMVWLINHKWFENFIMALIFINSMLLGVKDYTDYENKTPINQFIENCEPFFTYMFLIECVSKILAMGFILGDKCYLYDSWNWLDFTVVVTSLLEELPSMENMSGLRTFRLFRPLKSLTNMPSMKLLIGTLFSSIAHLGGLFGLSIFIFIIFAILGVSLWAGRIHYRCYLTESPIFDEKFKQYSWPVNTTDERLCYPGIRECAPGNYCNSTVDFEFNGGLYDRNMTIDPFTFSQIRALNYGITHFDNIFSAILTVFQCITMEGWTHIMNMFVDSYLGMVVNVYFISCVVICSFFLLNLTIAVMLMKYEELDKNQTNCKHNEELRQFGLSIKLSDPMIDFLIKQDSIQITCKAKKMIKVEDSFLKQLFAPKRIPVDMTDKYYHNRVVKFCLSIGMNPYFDVLIMFVIVINTLCLTGDMYPELDQAVIDVLQYMNFVFTFIFTIEVILKMIGLGAREFLKEKFNQFDLLIVIISIVEMQLVNSEGEGGVFSALRAIRLFKIFKLFKVGDLRILIDSIAFTMTAISDYVVLLSLFIYVFALLGMSQFAGQLKFDEEDNYNMEDGKSPRNNFDNVGWSLVLIFQVLLGENWNFIMYDCMRSKGSLSAFYFIGLVVGGNIIMLNLFLAILLGNFEKARNFGQKKKVFEAFREIKTGSTTLNQALDIILNDMSIHVKIKILKWDETIVQKFHETGDTSLAQDLMEEGARFMREESDDELQCKVDDQIVSSKRLVDKPLPQDQSDKDSMYTHSEDLNDKRQQQEEQDLEQSHGQSDAQIQKSDHQSYNQGSALGSIVKDKPEPEKVVKKKFESSKLVYKMHKYNFKLFRLKEMKRFYNMTDSKALLMILQKDMDISQQEMKLVNEDEIISRYSGQNYQSALEHSPVSLARVEKNIERFKSTDYLQQLENEQNKEVQIISEHIKLRLTMTEPKICQLDSERSKNNENENQNKNKIGLLEDTIKLNENESFNSIIQSSLSLEKPKSKKNQEESKEQIKSSSSNENLMLTLPKKQKTKNKNQIMGTFLEPMQIPSFGRHSSQKQPLRATTMKPNQKEFDASQEIEFKTQKTCNVNKISYDEKNKIEHFRSAASIEDRDSRYLSNNRDSTTMQKRMSVFPVQESFKEPNFIERLIQNRSDSSLLIFHKDGWLRRKCLILAESPENLDDLQQLEEKEQLLMEDKQRQENTDKELTYLCQGQASKTAVNYYQYYEESVEEEESQGSKSENLTEQSNRMSVANMSRKNTSNNIDGQTVTNQDQSDAAIANIHNKGSFIGLHQQKPQAQKLLYFGVHPSKIFENIVLTLITLSSFTLVVDNPLNDPKSQQMRMLAYIDQFFTMMFTMEAIIKIIAKGLIFNRMGPIEPYLSSPWNMLDAFVVMASLIDFVFAISGFDMQQLSAIKALRAFRALRPLRMISRNEGMRLVVNALLASLPSMGNVLLVGSLFLLIFAIMGVNFFKGKFFYCADLQFRREDQQANLMKVITKYDCVNYGGNWVLKDANFDNTISAMLTLFQLTQTEGWVDVMFDGIDSTQVGYQPKQYTSVYLIFYFIAFMTVGSQFIVNLFVGVVIDNFNTIKEREELGNMFVTEQQKSWIDIQKIALLKNLKTKLDEPTDPVRIKFFNLVKMKKFEYTITFFILLNTVFMTLKYHNMNHYLKLISFYANYMFAFVFNAEMILKLIGMGSTYFLDSWNKFDCFIVIATDIGLILNLFDIGGGLSTATTVIRGVRILRIFRLIKSSVHIRLILDTIMNILPHIQNVMTLFVLMLFIYAALAINIFSQVQPQYYLDEKNNFQTFTGSMIMLWKFSTGEDWNKFMYELANSKGHRGKNCQDMQTFEDIKQNGINGCGTIMAYPFFISFTILVTMLILNLSVAAVIGGLDTAKKENMGFVKGDEIEYFIDLWQEFDPFASGWIKMDELIFLLYDLPPPMGLPNRTYFDDKNNDPESQKGLKQQDRYLVSQERCIIMKKVDALDLLRGLNIKVYQHPQKQIHFASVFKALIKRVFNSNGIDYKLSTTLNRKMKGQWSKKYTEIANKDKGQYTVREEQAGLIITKWAKKSISNYKYQVMAKNEQIKKNINKKKFQIEDQMKAQGKQRKNRQENLIEQADIIQNIIHGQASGRSNSTDHNKKDYAINNEYSWKNPGGQKIYEEVFDDADKGCRKSHDSSDLQNIKKQIEMELGYKFNRSHHRRGKSFNQHRKMRRNKTLMGGDDLTAKVQIRKYEQNYYHNKLFSTNVFNQNDQNMQQIQDVFQSNSKDSSDDTSSILSSIEERSQNYESPGLQGIKKKGISITIDVYNLNESSNENSQPKAILKKTSSRLDKLSVKNQSTDDLRRTLSENLRKDVPNTGNGGSKSLQMSKLYHPKMKRSKTKLKYMPSQHKFIQMKTMMKKDLLEFQNSRKQQSAKDQLPVQARTSFYNSAVPNYSLKEDDKVLLSKTQAWKTSTTLVDRDGKGSPLVLNLVESEQLVESQNSKNRAISTLKPRQNSRADLMKDHQAVQNNFLGEDIKSGNKKIKRDLSIKNLKKSRKATNKNNVDIYQSNQSLSDCPNKDSEDSNEVYANDLANSKKNEKRLTADNFPLDINIVEKKRQQSLKKSLFGGSQKIKDRQKASKKQQNLKGKTKQSNTDTIQQIESQDVVGKQLFDKYMASAKQVNTSPCAAKIVVGYKDQIGNSLIKAYQKAASEAAQKSTADVACHLKDNTSQDSLKTDESVQEYLDREEQY